MLFLEINHIAVVQVREEERVDNKMVCLLNDRLYLREMFESDWVDVHKYASQEVVCQYQPWGPNTEEESEKYVSQAIEDSIKKPRKRYVYAIIYNGSVIGAGEINIRSFTNKAGEIGYIVNPDYWGKGIATEVATLLIDFGFKELNLHRIFATCDPRNNRSAKVLEKVGMAREGIIRDHLFMRGGWRDSLLYSVLQDEWTR